MNKILKKLEQFGIVPVVVLEDDKDAALLAKALCDGGLACAEVTFRTAAAEESIRIMSEKFPEMVVGAGTVLTVEQVDRAVKAGAQFIVSPGFNPVVVKYCRKYLKYYIMDNKMNFREKIRALLMVVSPVTIRLYVWRKKKTSMLYM